MKKGYWEVEIRTAVQMILTKDHKVQMRCFKSIMLNVYLAAWLVLVNSPSLPDVRILGGAFGTISVFQSINGYIQIMTEQSTCKTSYKSITRHAKEHELKS
jgi:hypothetical protein